MALSNKQRMFIEEYLKCFNATQAAIAAGYSEKTAHDIGWENLRKPEIALVISRRLSEAAMTADEVIRRLSEQARADYAAYILPDGEIDLPKIIADGKTHLVKGIRNTRFGKNIEFHDAQAALVQIGKHHKLFTEKTEVTGADGNALEIELNDTERAARLASLLDAGRDRRNRSSAENGQGDLEATTGAAS